MTITNKRVVCKYLTDTNQCKSVLENDEVRDARRTNCENDNETACCYLCDYQEICEIKCNYLGETQKLGYNRKTKNKVQDGKEMQILRCHLCGLKMRPLQEVKFRIGGWEGGWRLLGELGELGEIEEKLLPVIIYFCAKCGRIELVATEKTKKKFLQLSKLSLA